MSTSPSRTPASGAARRVSFSHAQSHLKVPLGTPEAMAMADASPRKSGKSTEREEAQRGENALKQKSPATFPAAARDSSSATVGRRDAQPMTASQRTGDASSSNPPCQSFPGDNQNESTEWPSASCITAALEFSLEDTPLASRMRPPVWRESLPSTAASSSHNFPAPSRQVTTVGDTKDRPSTRGRNVYTDVEREVLNQKRRHILVQHFFTFHEDAVRLYIRLEQLLEYRDLCEVEFRERLQAIPSEVAKLVPQTSTCGGHATEPAREIERLQAALARIAATSPGLPGAWGELPDSLMPSQLLTSSRQAATEKQSSHIPSTADVERAGGTHVRRAGQSLSEGSSAAAKKAGETNSPMRRQAAVSQEPRPTSISTVRGTGARCPSAESSGTFTANEAGKQSPPSQPRTALEAWRSARKGGLLSVAQTAKSAEPSPTASAGATRSRGSTPRDSGAVSHLTSASTGAAAVSVELAATDEAKILPKRPILSLPRKAAAPSAENGRQGVDAATATPLRCGVVDNARVATPRSELRSTLSWLHQVSAPPGLASPPPQPLSSPYRMRDSAAAAAPSEPQRPSGSTVLRSKALVDTPDRRSPVCTMEPPKSPSLKDSPLARYRAKQGCRDPASHSHSRLADTLPPTSSATHYSPQWATATGEPSGAPTREKDEGSVTSSRPLGDTENGILRGAQTALLQQRQRLAPLRNEGRTDAAQDTCASGLSEGRPTSVALGVTRQVSAGAASRPLLAPSSRPTDSSARAQKLSLETYSYSSASTESSPSHSQGSDVPVIRCTTKRYIDASTAKPSHRSISTSHSLPTDAQHRGPNFPSASASAPPPRSTASHGNGAAASVRTELPIRAMNRNRLSGAAEVAGSWPLSRSLDSPVQNQEVVPTKLLLSEDRASWSPADSAAEPIVGDLRLSATHLRAPEDPQEAERNMAVTSAALLRGATRGRSSEPHMHGSNSTCDVNAAIGGRVGGLDSRTTALERNEAKRAVLEGIRNLKLHVNIVEERTALLERPSVATSLHIGWHQS
ncbi:hypothetical protein GH5_01465 [Leishmania sp. Ghana 2012 LV757]|uniref:hypothetical protein n=1 Tax=Leishmania sp. Ghana 2012 LV757 TaxID=2803181 RepID=UPI001B630FD7|nr:hypothetical protein GH5_01465 [Leishmania sp. Ghana 2012 LV757]